MEKKNVEHFLNLYSEFEKQCFKIAHKMKAYNNDYAFIDYFHIDTESKSVIGEGEYRWGCGSNEIDYYYVDFDVNLLGYTDEELDAYVDKLYQEKLERESAANKKAEEESLAYRRAQYEKLKKELGL